MRVNGSGAWRDWLGVEAMVPVTETSEAADYVDAERLYVQYRRELVAFARVLSGSATAAEEAVQDVFVSLYRRSPRIEAGRELAYLRRATLLRVRGGWRHQSVARRHLRSLSSNDVDERTPETTALAQDRRDRIDSALSKLSRRQRECIALRYFADLTEPAVADHLGISVGSVKTHLHRARNVLATSLEDLR